VPVSLTTLTAPRLSQNFWLQFAYEAMEDFEFYMISNADLSYDQNYIISVGKESHNVILSNFSMDISSSGCVEVENMTIANMTRFKILETEEPLSISSRGLHNLTPLDGLIYVVLGLIAVGGMVGLIFLLNVMVTKVVKYVRGEEFGRIEDNDNNSEEDINQVDIPKKKKALMLVKKQSWKAMFLTIVKRIKSKCKSLKNESERSSKNDQDNFEREGKKEKKKSDYYMF